jgi:uracil-DNA glycosylase
MSLTRLLRDVRACRVCENDLPAGPRPVLRLARTARLLIIGQAPGSKVHRTGTPWDDPSGERLREWTQLASSVFYDQAQLAIIPIGLCYPGAGKHGGDNPPRPECAALWHERLLAHLPDLRLTLLVGQYAQQYYLGPRRKDSMTETVRAFMEYGPRLFPLPHPSWRSVVWMRKNPWLEQLVVPALREAVSSSLATDASPHRPDDRRRRSGRARHAHPRQRDGRGPVA